MDYSDNPKLWFQAIVDYAPALREAGVLHVKFGTCELILAPSTPPAVRTEPREEPPDAMSDPLTFGGRVPSYPRPGLVGD